MNIGNIVGLILISVSGTICNTFVIFYITKKDSETTLKDKVIILLCSFNLFQVFGYTIEIYSTFRGAIDDHCCNVSAFTICFSTYASICCFVVLVVERYICIIHTFCYSVWCRRKLVVLACLALPILQGLFFGAAPLLGWGRYGRSRPTSTYCAFDFNDETDIDRCFFVTAIMFTFVIPILITIACFARILVEIRRTASSFKKKLGVYSVQTRSSNRAYHGQYISSLLIGAIYIISWVPYSVVCVMFYAQMYVPVPLEYFAKNISKSASVSSPIVFCIIEKQVRKFIKSRTATGLHEMTLLSTSFRTPTKRHIDV